jgi:hypothetical protein
MRTLSRYLSRRSTSVPRRRPRGTHRPGHGPAPLDATATAPLPVPLTGR